NLTLDDAALPAALDDRAQDGWEPLIAIADAAGGAWPARARRAAEVIFAKRAAADDNLPLRMLHDCRTVFDGVVEDFLPTAQLRAGLVALPESPWSDIRGKEVTPHFMAKLLKGFEIESGRDRVGRLTNPLHGYRRSDFLDAWERYASVAGESGTTGTNGTVE